MKAHSAQILRITADDYHQRDGLSASIATTLIERSPLHAWSQHPRFGGKGKKATKTMDRGAVVHALVLGAGKGYRVLPFDSFRTDAAKDAKEDAQAEGLVAILEKDFADAKVIAERALAQLAERGIVFDGESELAIEWTEETDHGPVLCRGMMDHLKLAGGAIYDLKIVSDAAQDALERKSEDYGYAIQQAAYRRAIGALDPDLVGRTDFLFLFCEPEEPYAMNVCRPDGAMRELGERRWTRAVTTWGRCLRDQRWPGYGEHVNRLSAPQWVLAREEI